jgi:hypothetical protein
MASFNPNQQPQPNPPLQQINQTPQGGGHPIGAAAEDDAAVPPPTTRFQEAPSSRQLIHELYEEIAELDEERQDLQSQINDLNANLANLTPAQMDELQDLDDKMEEATEEYERLTKQFDEYEATYGAVNIDPNFEDQMGGRRNLAPSDFQGGTPQNPHI